MKNSKRLTACLIFLVFLLFFILFRKYLREGIGDKDGDGEQYCEYGVGSCMEWDSELKEFVLKENCKQCGPEEDRPEEDLEDGTKCNDDPDWVMRGRRGKTRKCDWVKKKPEKRCGENLNLRGKLVQRIGTDGVPSSVACAKACGTC